MDFIVLDDTDYIIPKDIRELRPIINGKPITRHYIIPKDIRELRPRAM